MVHRNLFVLLLGSLLVLLGGACGKRAANQPVASTAKYDACSLITKEEIQAVQDSPIKDTVPSARADGGIRVAQCFFTAEQSNRSVSLAVTHPDPDSPAKRSATELWEQTFGRYDRDEKESEKEKDKKEPERARGQEEEGTPPRRISGLGEEAYWVGSPVGGALYVLKKDAFIRISLGGPEKDSEAKIEKSRKLAEKAIGRL